MKRESAGLHAADVMTTPALAVGPEADVQQVAELLLECRISAVPVVADDGRILGIVSEGDLINREDAGTRHRRSWWLEMFKGQDAQAREFIRDRGSRAADVMTPDVVTVTEDTPLPEVAATLERHRIKRVPVLRDGAVVGIVSRANLLHGLALGVQKPLDGSDRTTRQALIAALKEAGLPMHQVSVTVRKGVASFWGWIDSELQRQAAHTAAESTPGVRRYEDNLVVSTAALRAGRGYV